MKIITKEIPIDELILKVKTNYKNSEKYFLLSTKEVIHLIEEKFNVHCPDLKSTTLTCFVEQSPKEYSHPLIIIEIDKKFVEKEELEQFVQMEDELFSLILVAYKLDYDLEDEINWFIRKIKDIDLNTDNFMPKNKDSDFFIKNDVLGSSTIRFEVTVRKCTSPFYEQAHDLQDKGEHLESLRFFKIAHELDKTYFSYFSLGLCYHNLQKYSQSIDCLKESLKHNNKNQVARILLSHNYFNEGYFENALRELENIDRTNLRLRDLVTVEIALAKVYLALGYDEKSNFHFKNAEEITPEKFRSALLNTILFQQFSFYHEIQDYQKCCKILKILIEKFPSDSRLYSKLGSYKFMLNELMESEKFLLESLNLDPNDIIALVFLFTVYLQQRKFSKAIEFSKKLNKVPEQLGPEFSKRISDLLLVLPRLAEKEKTIQLDDALNEINSKDDYSKSYEQFHLEITKQLKNFSSTSNSNIEKFPKVSIEDLKKTDVECLNIVRQFIRNKYSGNINFLKDDKDLFSNGFDNDKSKDNYVYRSIEKNFKRRENSIQEQEPINDLFDCLDFGNFPFIILRKWKSWELSKNSVDLLKTIVSGRNTSSHHSGPGEFGNLSHLDTTLHYVTCKKIIAYFEDKLRI